MLKHSILTLIFKCKKKDFYVVKNIEPQLLVKDKFLDFF